MEALQDLSYNRNIHILDAHFNDVKKAACIYDEDKLIVMDKSVIYSKTEETELLAEEIGHYETGALYMIDASKYSGAARSSRRKYEARAKHWAYKRLASKDKIEEAINNGCYDEFDIAEWCGVSVEFLRQTIEYHKNLKFMSEEG